MTSEALSDTLPSLTEAPTRALEAPKKSSIPLYRRKIFRRIAEVFASGAVAFGIAGWELTKTKEFSPDPARAVQSMRQLPAILRDLGIRKITRRFASDTDPTPEERILAAEEEKRAKTDTHAFMLPHRVAKGEPTAILKYITHYQLPRANAQECEPENRCCNTDARAVCETLTEYGLPMYYVSVCPAETEKMFQHSWHQFAACKIEAEHYIIIDGKECIVWSGTLAQFAKQFYRGEEMHLVPMLGIAKYREPTHDIWLARWLINARESVEESQMETAEFPAEYEKIASR